MLSTLPHPKLLTHQRGAALITSLMLLIVLTLIGVSVMQATRMQERMTGNARDVNTAFESAEAALRNGEALVRQQIIAPIYCSAPPCKFWSQGTFMSTPTFVGTPLGDVSKLTPAWWTANATAFADATNAPLTGMQDRPKENPQYIVETQGAVRTDGGVEVNENPPPHRTFFQVTARSTGASGLADVVVQSTYAVKTF